MDRDISPAGSGVETNFAEGAHRSSLCCRLDSCAAEERFGANRRRISGIAGRPSGITAGWMGRCDFLAGGGGISFPSRSNRFADAVGNSHCVQQWRENYPRRGRGDLSWQRFRLRGGLGHAN
jgi:hypothetical protein